MARVQSRQAGGNSLRSHLPFTGTKPYDESKIDDLKRLVEKGLSENSDMDGSERKKFIRVETAIENAKRAIQRRDTARSEEKPEAEYIARVELVRLTRAAEEVG